jgi:hypothetical protein
MRDVVILFVHLIVTVVRLALPGGLWSAKIPSGGFQRNVTLLHSDRLPSEALCCAKIPSYFLALTDPRTNHPLNLYTVRHVT